MSLDDGRQSTCANLKVNAFQRDKLCTVHAGAVIRCGFPTLEESGVHHPVPLLSGTRQHLLARLLEGRHFRGRHAILKLVYPDSAIADDLIGVHTNVEGYIDSEICGSKIHLCFVEKTSASF